MKYPEYDSPFELTMSEITTQMARNFDEMCWKAVQRVGVNVDKDKLLIALRHDSERYREAYANGYATGYEKRDDDIVRCKDCRFRYTECCIVKDQPLMDTFYCWQGIRKDGDGE